MTAKYQTCSDTKKVKQCSPGKTRACADTYAQARGCDDGELADVWMTMADATAVGIDTGAFKITADGFFSQCYNFLSTDILAPEDGGPPTTPGGTLYALADVTTFEDCTNCAANPCNCSITTAYWDVCFDKANSRLVGSFTLTVHLSAQPAYPAAVSCGADHTIVVSGTFSLPTGNDTGAGRGTTCGTWGGRASTGEITVTSTTYDGSSVSAPADVGLVVVFNGANATAPWQVSQAYIFHNNAWPDPYSVEPVSTASPLYYYDPAGTQWTGDATALGDTKTGGCLRWPANTSPQAMNATLVLSFDVENNDCCKDPDNGCGPLGAPGSDGGCNPLP